MSEQQVKLQHWPFDEGIPEPVLMSATHALKLKNYSIPNMKYWLSHRTFDDPEKYPLDLINAFFNTIRIEGYLTGYAQIISAPVNWVDKYKGDLLDLKGVSNRVYPVDFNNFYWDREDFPEIDEQTLINITQLYKGLLERENKKINLACSRLENSFYRSKEGDRVIDIVIGLESILSDGEKGELTHKLSLRAAFLLQDSNLRESKIEIFKNMKSIYDYRSAIVHGESQSKIDKKRYISRNGEKQLVVKVAELYLKECIKTLIYRPEFLVAKNIDEKLILGYMAE